MEFEISDDPQGEKDDNLGDRDGGIVEDHSALKNQSSVEPEDYQHGERRRQSLNTAND